MALKKKDNSRTTMFKNFQKKTPWNIILKTRNLKKKGKPTRGESRFDVSFAAYHYETFFFHSRNHSRKNTDSSDYSTASWKQINQNHEYIDASCRREKAQEKRRKKRK